eukprot:Clim_evm10s8 gene=Clim_evmTU10s8
MSATVVRTWKSKMPACSVEVCGPYAFSGHYQLQEDETKAVAQHQPKKGPQTRHGMINIHDWRELEAGSVEDENIVPHLECHTSGGVLDMKFLPTKLPNSQGTMLACALSNGNVALYRWQAPTEGKEFGQLQPQTSIELGEDVTPPTEEEIEEELEDDVILNRRQAREYALESVEQNRACENIALAVDWWGPRLAVTDSRGYLHILDTTAVLDSGDSAGVKAADCPTRLGPEGTRQGLQAHTLEAWTVCWQSPIDETPRWTATQRRFTENWEQWPETEIVWTGGDDAALCVWDLRVSPVTERPVLANRREHQAGVTALARHGKAECMISGSYDDTVRIWDCRALRQPLGSLEVGGGVWRIKPHPIHGSRRTLLACMYNGFAVADLSDPANPELSLPFQNPHESIGYGAEWLVEDDEEDKATLSDMDKGRAAVCSFYDMRCSIFDL